MTPFDRVKELSKSRDKNLRDVATELGFGENYFYTWKNKSPSADRVLAVADYFNVSTDYILCHDQKLTSVVTDIFTRQLLKQIDTLDNNHKQRVYAYAQAQSENQAEIETLAAHQADSDHRIDETEASYISDGMDKIIDDFEKKRKK